MSNRRTLAGSICLLMVALLVSLCRSDDTPQAAPVPADAAVKPSAVHGLEVAFYDFYPKDANGIDSIEIAKNWIAGHQPTLAYRLNLPAVSVPPDGPDLTTSPLNTTMGDFLLGKAEYAKRKGADQGDKATPARFDQAVGPRTIYVFTGFIKVEKAGTYFISAPCDDGDEVKIGGVVVQARPSFGGATSPDAPENIGHVEFTEAGLYPLQVILYDRDPGQLGIQVFSDINPKGKRHATCKTFLTVLRSAK
jgi:hypothetical protein